VAETLAPGLTQDEKTLLTRRSTENPEAYALYLKGNYYWSKRGDEAGHSAAYFRQAIKLDPTFAQAYVGLASIDAVLSAPSPEAEILIEKALKLDNKSAEAHATYGFIRMFHHWDWAGAGRAFDYALELNPNSSLTHHWKGVYLSLLGRLDEAKAEMHRALELDPLSLIITADIGQLHYFAHEYDEAIVYCKRAVALDGKFEMAHLYLVDIYGLKGMEDESLEEWIKYESGKIRPEELEEARANAHRLGERALLQQAVASLIDTEKAHPGVLAYQIARVYVKLGDKEAALHWLEQAVDQKLFLTPFVKVDPVFDPLRGHPRFRNVVQRMGL
jgi:tetratricopeptide (TPR) repeat protein